ncbi:PH domain-containing protein [Thermomonas sp. HDW16]|uniref:PH domain-containing protein n=1 Tax=Thermomonas sp. HDW16 TaxID=2714945 RepID=UPI001F10B163|nr:PH domain-containing protein [Thermomonas sp. HDW16]
MTSTDFDAPRADATPEPATPALDAWHAPPTRAVRLHAGFVAAMFALCAIGAMAGPLFAMDEYGLARFGIAFVVLVLSAAFGAWIGARLRHQRWKLDAEGLWLRTGRLWWRETRVPASRVQHVDLKHGPLERRFKLATLVVHTAAVHLSGITVRGLDEADAQQLRDALARQLDDAGDAL